MISVFLGGTCNNSTWRDELMSKIDTNKVNAFNPIVEHWDEEAQKREDYHKQNDDFCLYVLTPEMKGIYSIFEIADDSNKRPDRTLFCQLTERDGKIFDPFVQRNFDKIKKDLTNNGVKVFDSLEEISVFLNNYEKEKLNEETKKDFQSICSKLEQIKDLKAYYDQDPNKVIDILESLVSKYDTLKSIKDNDMYHIYAIEKIMELGDNNPSFKAISDSIVGYYDDEENMVKSESQINLNKKINEILGGFDNINASEIDYITYVNNLDDYLYDLANLGDLKELQETNPSKFYDALKPALKIYYCLMKDNNNEKKATIIKAILLSYVIDNPSLKGVVSNMMNIKFGEVKKFDKDTFVQTTYSLIDEFEGKKGIDTNNVGDFEAAFQKLASILNNNKASFSEQEYSDLANDLSVEINKIDKFNQVYEENLSRIASL